MSSTSMVITKGLLKNICIDWSTISILKLSYFNFKIILADIEHTSILFNTFVTLLMSVIDSNREELIFCFSNDKESIFEVTISLV